MASVVLSENANNFSKKKFNFNLVRIIKGFALERDVVCRLCKSRYINSHFPKVGYEKIGPKAG